MPERPRRARRTEAGTTRISLVGATLLLTALMSGAGHAQTVPAPLAFDAVASASGAQTTLLIDDTTGFDPPADVGGPTAQAVFSSLGQGTAFASLPYPGEFVVTVPGLLTGLFADRGLPALPSYPFIVQADAANPEQSQGSGPYTLRATSQPDVVEALGSAGFDIGGVGSTALVASTAEISAGEGEVTSTALARMEGFAAGPLAIGEIRSFAKMSIDPAGLVTRTSSIEVNGMRIAGVPIGVNADGLAVPGSDAVPLPVNDTFARLLDDAGIQIRVLPGRETEDTVIAPAVEITMPFDTVAIPNVGQFTGTSRTVVGFSTVTLIGAAPPDFDIPGAPEAEAVPSLPAGPAPTTAGTSTAAPSADPSVPNASPPTPGPSIPPNPASAASLAAVISDWEVLSVYLMLTACAALVIGGGRRISRNRGEP